MMCFWIGMATGFAVSYLLIEILNKKNKKNT